MKNFYKNKIKVGIDFNDFIIVVFVMLMFLIKIKYIKIHRYTNETYKLIKIIQE